MQLHRHNQLRALATQVHSFSSTEPVSHTHDVTAIQDIIAKIVEEEKILNARIDRLIEDKREIREIIDPVKNVTLRLILESTISSSNPVRKAPSIWDYQPLG